MLSLDWNLLITVINLVIFYVLLRIFLFKPVNNIIEKREKLIADRLSDAQKKNDDAEELKKQYRASLDNAENEGEQIKKASREEARAEYGRIVADANKKAGRIIDKAKVTAEGEYQKVVETAQQQIAEMAASAALKIVNEKDAAVNNNSLYDAFLAKTSETKEGE